jgi:nucleoside-diphosphate-sugar epimerase
MGGAGYIFTGEHDADVMHNSATINLNVADRAREVGVGKIFYSSSACMYPEYNQLDPENPKCSEDSAYPAQPDSEYGWEKLFSERLYLAYQRNHGLEIHIARFHNIFGPEGTWCGGREKAPAAICRKVATAKVSGVHEIEIWGDGRQGRSFMFIDDCTEGILRIMDSDVDVPINLGSSETVTIDDLVAVVEEVAGIRLQRTYRPAAPKGVDGRSSDNGMIRARLGWQPSTPLRVGIEQTYAWIYDQYTAREKRLRHQA